METDTFEKNIRTKLQGREINPSTEAWERISRELGSRSSSKKTVYLWMGIAASVVVLLGITLFYFNRDIEELNGPLEVVETNKKEQLKLKKGKQALPFGNQEATVASKDSSQELLNTKTDVVESKAASLEGKLSVNQNEIGVGELNRMETKTTGNRLKLSEQIINDKIAELVTQVDHMEQYTTVTDAEVDSLLKRAQEEILREKIFKTNTAVDATALLAAVEDELDQSFRDQIFNSLKAGFIKVRTAVADRNN